MSTDAVTVCAFYRFAPIADPIALRDRLRSLCSQRGIVGSVLIAHEGINGTIAGARDDVDAFEAAIRSTTGLADARMQRSEAPSLPFLRLKVEHKAEIVTFHQPQVDPTAVVGRYVPPAEWNALIERKDVVLVDARNDFEFELGTFQGAINPQTTSFSEFAAWVDTHLDPQRDQHVAMFCTGGIRCEKATSYLLQKGFTDVAHLDGGITAYLSQIPVDESRWQGECFIFDQRTSLGHGLVPGTARVCHACYRAVDEAGLASPHYEEGISCARCVGTATPQQVASRRERQKQVKLAAARQRKHIGDVMPRR
jgi:UPF0176 protein